MHFALVAVRLLACRQLAAQIDALQPEHGSLSSLAATSLCQLSQPLQRPHSACHRGVSVMLHSLVAALLETQPLLVEPAQRSLCVAVTRRCLALQTRCVDGLVAQRAAERDNTEAQQV